MSPNAQQIFWNIINCSNISSCSCSSSSNNPCKTIIGYQRQFACHWQVPEPWNGDIEKAPILFILSNPSYSATEVYPEDSAHSPICKQKYNGQVVSPSPNCQNMQPGIAWNKTNIEIFFEKRFERIRMPSGKLLEYVQGLKTLQNDGSYSNKPVNTWVGLCKYAIGILHGIDMSNNGLTTLVKNDPGFNNATKLKIGTLINSNVYVVDHNGVSYEVNPGVDFALTEVVKCKSTSEIGVKDADSECSNKHLGAVLSLFKGHTICVCGRTAQEVFNNHLKNSGLQVIPLSTEVIFLPHPSRAKNVIINGVKVL